MKRRTSVLIIPAPNLILGRGPCPRPSVHRTARLGATVEGRWLVQLVSRGGIIRQELEFPNLVVDAGLDTLHTLNGSQIGASVVNRVAVGTGSTAPAAGQTALVAEVARMTTGPTIAGSYDSGGGYGYGRYTWEFDYAVANGNLTEVGIFTGAGGAMFSRALFTDSGGTPTTIVKTSSDKLRLRYEWRVYPPASADTVDPTYNLSGVSTAVSHRPIGKATNGWSEHAQYGPTFMGQASGGQLARSRNSLTPVGYTALDNNGDNATSATWAAYTAGDHHREVSILWETGDANYAGGTPGIGGCIIARSAFNGNGTWDITFTPRVAKDNTKRFVLDLDFVWARV
jgi:hypothetical protein